MAKIRMIVIEGEMEVDDVRRLAQAFSAGDAAFTSIALPNGVTGQAATLSKGEDKPRPRPLAVPPIITYEKPEATEAPAPAVTVATPPPTQEIPPAVAKVFPEAVVEPEAATDIVADLLACKRLSGVLERLQRAGHADLPAIIEACKTYRDQIPLLQRLGEGLEDRVTRTHEGMK